MAKDFDLEKLWFYFDAIERDRMDIAGRSSRSGEILALRDKLLSMPQSQYEAAMKTIQKVVNENAEVADAKTKAKDAARRNAQELFEQTSAGAGSAFKATKVSHV